MGYLGSIFSADTDTDMETADIGSGRASWSRGPLLGRGSFGRVNIGFDSASGELIAVKSVRVTENTSHELHALENEYEILQQLDSPNVIKCFGADWSMEDGVPTRNLLLALASGGNLAELASSAGCESGLCEADVARHVRGVVEGLSYIHEQGVVHCDLKARNIVLGDSCVVLVDFGLSLRRREAAGSQEVISDHDLNRKEKLRGTPCWMAPEVVAGGDIGAACDVWSLGCTVIELLTGKPPWSSQCADPMSVLYKLGCTSELPRIPQNVSPSCNNFIHKCLHRDPQQRPTAAELLTHPFLRVQEAIPKAYSTPSHPASSPPLTEVTSKGRLHVDMPSSPMALDSDEDLNLNLTCCKMVDELCALFPPTPSPRLVSPLHMVAQDWGSLTRPSHHPNPTTGTPSNSKFQWEEGIRSKSRPPRRPSISVPAQDGSSLDRQTSSGGARDNAWGAPSPASNHGCLEPESSPPELDPISPDVQEADAWQAWGGER
ncbi:hypothetical protein CLOM_g24480 [Closterium sp. NIES-68]|nr:hypothetical protein CLOM_g24480 [Closterium sp. NIES-68]GJP85079.1 hypothetical protein CLOP_g15180 [Closterium sp. NIES-67]